MSPKNRNAPTNVYVEETGRLVEPFRDPLGDIPILNKPLSAWQAQAFTGAGLLPAKEKKPPCLVVPDNLFTTAGALSAFVQGAAGRNAVLVLKQSLFGSKSTPVQPGVSEVDDGWRFDAIRFESGTDEPAVPIVVDPEEHVVTVHARDPYLGGDTIEFGIPRHPLMTLHHWVHILWANSVAGGIDVRMTPKWRHVLRWLWAAVRARSFNRWKVLGKLNRIGRGCDIHPTAIIEGCTLGDRVYVGPYARVLLSHIGDGVVMLPGAQVEFSVIGDRAVVTQQSTLRFSLLYEEAVASQPLMQQCVLGRQAVTTVGTRVTDLNLQNDIRVPLDGKLVSTGRRFLGSCIGHRARLGAGFWVAPGRSIPNDYLIIRDPKHVVSRVPEGLSQGAPLVAIGNEVQPI